MRGSRVIGARWAALLACATATSVALVASAGASARFAPDAQRGTGQIVIGAALDLSAGWTSLGRASRVTLRLAAADENASPAGQDRPVRLVIEDTRGTPAGNVRAVRALARQGARFVIGPQTSSGVQAVRPVARQLGVIVISQGSTAHSLAIAGDNVFRFVPDDIREGEAVVALLRRRGIDAIVPVWRRDAGNRGLAVSVRRQFRARGGRVSAGVPYGETTTNFGPVTASIARQAAALRRTGARRVAVYLAAFDEVVDLFRLARLNPALEALPWYGSDGVALTTRLLGDPLAAAFADEAGYPNPIVGLPQAVLRRARPLIRRVRRQLGRDPDAFALTAYDALRIAARAQRRAGTNDPAALRAALTQVADGYGGVTGRMTLNRAGDRAYGNYDFWSVCPGQGRFAWRRTFTYVARAPGAGRIVARSRC